MSRPDRTAPLALGVDDDPWGLDLLRVTLTAAGFDFFGVDSGEACLDALAQLRPDVILMDVRMPGLNGFETCLRLRAQYPLLAAPVLFLTASPALMDLTFARVAGGDDILCKPVIGGKPIERIARWSRVGRGPAAQPAVAVA